MQIRLSPSMRSITISSSNGFFDLMKLKIAARVWSFRTIFHTMLVLAVLLPFAFILTAVVTLEDVNTCSSFDCLGRRLGPRFLGRGADNSVMLVKDLHKILDQANSQEVPADLKLPESYGEFLSQMKDNHYDAKTFAIRLKATETHRLESCAFNWSKIAVLRSLRIILWNSSGRGVEDFVFSLLWHLHRTVCDNSPGRGVEDSVFSLLWHLHKTV